MRRLTALFSRQPDPDDDADASPRDGSLETTRRPDPRDEVTETICAPKLQPGRCLNESGHKLHR